MRKHTVHQDRQDKRGLEWVKVKEDCRIEAHKMSGVLLAEGMWLTQLLVPTREICIGSRSYYFRLALCRRNFPVLAAQHAGISAVLWESIPSHSAPCAFHITHNRCRPTPRPDKAKTLFVKSMKYWKQSTTM